MKKKLKRILKWLSNHIKKNKRIWVFGAWGGKLFADNTKYLFEYMNSIETDILPVWISKNQDVVDEIRALGYKAYKVHSVKGMLYALRAAVAFYTEGASDVSDLLSKKTKIIQLWHGMGIKAIGLESGWNQNFGAEELEKQRKIHREHHATWYWMCASKEAKQKYMRSCEVPEEMLFITGQPKDDSFVNVTKNSYINDIREKYPNARIAVYLPTHRNFGADSKIADIMSINTLEKVNEKLRAKNVVMIFKPHFHEFAKYEGYENSLSNIIFATDKKKYGDVYEFLPYCDLMITDYSGIMFGYLASGKPIIYFPYDYEEYVQNDAGFCYEYDDITYGPVCYTWDDVVESASTISAEDYAELREKQRERFCPYYDGKSCERVYEQVRQLLKI